MNMVTLNITTFGLPYTTRCLKLAQFASASFFSSVQFSSFQGLLQKGLQCAVTIFGVWRP